jgi:hypothetical protein
MSTTKRETISICRESDRIQDDTLPSCRMTRPGHSRPLHAGEGGSFLFIFVLLSRLDEEALPLSLRRKFLFHQHRVDGWTSQLDLYMTLPRHIELFFSFNAQREIAISLRVGTSGFILTRRDRQGGYQASPHHTANHLHSWHNVPTMYTP